MTGNEPSSENLAPTSSAICGPKSLRFYVYMRFKSLSGNLQALRGHSPSETTGQGPAFVGSEQREPPRSLWSSIEGHSWFGFIVGPRTTELLLAPCVPQHEPFCSILIVRSSR